MTYLLRVSTEPAIERPYPLANASRRFPGNWPSIDGVPPVGSELPELADCRDSPRTEPRA